MRISSSALITSPGLLLLGLLGGCSQAPFPESLAQDMAAETHALWRHDLGRALETSPVIREGRAYITVTDKKLLCLDIQTGKKIWKKKLEGPPTTGAVLTRSHVVVATGYPKSHVQGFDVVTGKELWKIQKAPTSCVALEEDSVLLGYDDGLWERLDSGSGEVLWSRQCGRRWGGDPAVHPESRTLWVATDPGSLVVLDSPSGDMQQGCEASTSPQMTWVGDYLFLVDGGAGTLQVRNRSDLSLPGHRSAMKPLSAWPFVTGGGPISALRADPCLSRRLPQPRACSREPRHLGRLRTEGHPLTLKLGMMAALRNHLSLF